MTHLNLLWINFFEIIADNLNELRSRLHYFNVASSQENFPLMFTLFFPLCCTAYIFIAGTYRKFWNIYIYNISLYCAALSFLSSLYLVLLLNRSMGSFQLLISMEFSQNYYLTFGIDYISLSLIILTNLFIYLCILSVRHVEIFKKITLSEFLSKLFFIQWSLLCAFSALDLLGFFIFFEATLIPMFTIILQGGSRERRTRASYLVALYTLFGSIFMLFNIIYLYNKYGSTNYLILYNSEITVEDQKILWITFFLAFAAKIPVFPFHIWLPEAHVEAPTIGSVLLAALLLKLGIYGLIRFGLPLFPCGQEYFKHFIVILTICSFFYTNLTAIRQVDIKKIIAYSSVVHMNLIVLGILCISVESLEGAIYQMLAHGIVSGALFFCIGIIYERFKSRFLWYYGGLAFILPLYSIFFFIFILANISFPTTSNFIGEMLLFLGIFKDNFLIGIFAALSMFWGVIYNVWTYNRICFGNIKFNYDQNARHAHVAFVKPPWTFKEDDPANKPHDIWRKMVMLKRVGLVSALADKSEFRAIYIKKPYSRILLQIFEWRFNSQIKVLEGKLRHLNKNFYPLVSWKDIYTNICFEKKISFEKDIAKNIIDSLDKPVKHAFFDPLFEKYRRRFQWCIGYSNFETKEGFLEIQEKLNIYCLVFGGGRKLKPWPAYLYTLWLLFMYEFAWKFGKYPVKSWPFESKDELIRHRASLEIDPKGYFIDPIHADRYSIFSRIRTAWRLFKTTQFWVGFYGCYLKYAEWNHFWFVHQKRENFKTLSTSIFTFKNLNIDLDKVDFYILFLLTFLLFLTGICSTVILDGISLNCTSIVNHSELMLIKQNGPRECSTLLNTVKPVKNALKIFLNI